MHYNSYGVKDSINTYLTINGQRYEQWSDTGTKEDYQKEHPLEKFIARKQPEGFTRIYRLTQPI